MIAQGDLQYLNGADVHATDGERIGSAGQVYLDERTGEPVWMSVRIGTPGAAECFVPLGEATLHDDYVEVPFGKDQIKAAPHIDTGGSLTPADEDLLCAHYGLAPGTGGSDADRRARDHVGSRPQSRTDQLRRYAVAPRQTTVVLPAAEPGGKGHAPRETDRLRRRFRRRHI